MNLPALLQKFDMNDGHDNYCADACNDYRGQKAYDWNKNCEVIIHHYHNDMMYWVQRKDTNMYYFASWDNIDF